MADGMPGIPWKEALKRLREYCAGDAMVGEPPAMQKELEGLEESLKGWELRDERRERMLKLIQGDTREKIAMNLLAGALAWGGTTFPPILTADPGGELWRMEQADKMVKCSVILADLLLIELTK